MLFMFLFMNGFLFSFPRPPSSLTRIRTSLCVEVLFPGTLAAKTGVVRACSSPVQASADSYAPFLFYFIL